MNSQGPVKVRLPHHSARAGSPDPALFAADLTIRREQMESGHDFDTALGAGPGCGPRPLPRPDPPAAWGRPQSL